MLEKNVYLHTSKCTPPTPPLLHPFAGHDTPEYSVEQRGRRRNSGPGCRWERCHLPPRKHPSHRQDTGPVRVITRARGVSQQAEGLLQKILCWTSISLFFTVRVNGWHTVCVTLRLAKFTRNSSPAVPTFVSLTQSSPNISPSLALFSLFTPIQLYQLEWHPSPNT
jgi:hypothetical protein